MGIFIKTMLSCLEKHCAMFFTKDFHKVCYPSASRFVDCDCTQVRPQHRRNIWNYVEHKCIISVNKEKLTKAKCCVLVELLHNTKYNIIKAISNSSMSFYSTQPFTKKLWHLLQRMAKIASVFKERDFSQLHNYLDNDTFFCHVIP